MALLVFVRDQISGEAIPVEVDARGTTADLLEEVRRLPQFKGMGRLRLYLPGGESLPPGSLADSGVAAEMMLGLDTGVLLSWSQTLIGPNMELEADETGLLRRARRVSSYNKSLLISEQTLDGPLISFSVKVTETSNYSGTLVLGFIRTLPDEADMTQHLGSVRTSLVIAPGKEGD
eukprot:Hpha_TRINITY_DN10401_c0_g1::TRINITY_DN10401_c0_g1_i2::g.193366::m.193366